MPRSLSLVAGVVLITAGIFVPAPHFIDSSELQSQFIDQARSHAIVLSILAALVGSFMSFTLNRYTPRRAARAPRRAMDINVAMALVTLIPSLLCFVVAAFTCAVLTGYGPAKNNVLPYAMLTLVHMLYAFGSLLTFIGALYVGRLHGLITPHTRRYGIMVSCSAMLMIWLLHQHISIQLYLATRSFHDFLLFGSGGLMVLASSFFQQRCQAAAEGSQIKTKMAWHALLGGMTLPTAIVIAACVYLNLSSIRTVVALPVWLRVIYYFFYPIVALYGAFAAAIFVSTKTPHRRRKPRLLGRNENF